MAHGPIFFGKSIQHIEQQNIVFFSKEPHVVQFLRLFETYTHFFEKKYLVENR